MKSFKISFSTYVHIGLILPVLFLVGCNEEEDEVSPRVMIDSPFENQAFQSTDTIEVIATITDNESINSVEIELLDLDFNMVGRKEIYQATGSTVNFSQLYPIGEELISSGDYYLTIRAKDDNNVGSGFVKIRINAIPLILEGVVVMTKAFNQARIYYREEEELEFELERNFFSDPIGVGLNYRQNILVTAGGEAGDGVFIELEEFQPINSIPGFGNIGLPFFSAATYDPITERFFIALQEGIIRVFDKNSSQLLAFDGLIEHIPEEIFGSTEGYFIEEKEIDNSSTVLNYYSFQGLLFDVFQVFGPVRGFYDRNFNEKFVWVDNPDGFELRLLNLTTKFLSLPYQRTGASLTDVVRISDNTFILSTSEGLLRYNYSNGGVSPINSSAPEGEIFFDDLNQLVYLAAGDEVLIFTTDGSQVGTRTFSEAVVFVGFDYNR
ncbi:MAG: Ig-like domain-containing protein [Bacteroidota bacterium]